MNALTVIRAAIPNASEELCEHIVWGRTPFPFAKVPAQALYKAASRYARAKQNNVSLCDWCDNKATIRDLCANCAKALDA